MSLTSLADAPLLSKPAGAAGSPLLRSRSCPVTKLKEDQAAIDALFQEDVGMKRDKTYAERKNIPPTKEPPCSTRKFELNNYQGEAASLPALLPLSQQTGDLSKNRQSKQDDCLFSSTKDASDVLVGFLADNTIDMNVNKLSGPSPLEDAKKDQREDFKLKWNSYSPQPLGGLPTLAISPRLALGSTLSTPVLFETSNSPTKLPSDYLSSLKKDAKWAERDVLFLLPDESNKSGNEGAITENSSYAPTTCCQNVVEENSDFGGYQPSCLSMTKPTHTIQRRHLTNFFPSSEDFDEKGMKMGVAESCEKQCPPSILMDSITDQIEMLKNMHTMELERRDKQLCMEEKKELELERETVLCMREQICQADATLRKQLHEHAVRMQTEAEEMARQKRELEHAKNIAAEIALEVERSRRELEMYKTTLNKTLPEGPCTEDSLTAYLVPKLLPKFGRKLELSRSRELHRRPSSSADVHRTSFYGMDLLEPSKPFHSEEAVIQEEVQEGMSYIRAQEEFLIQAEKALKGMSFNELSVPTANC